MWDTTLKTLKPKTLESALSLWGADPTSFELVSSGINLVYRIIAQSRIGYLRVTHEKLRSIAELQAALSYQQHLTNCHVPICNLVKSIRGSLVEALEQDSQHFFVHVTQEVPGVPMHFEYEDKALYERWGMVLGMLHKASVNYEIGNHRYPSWEGEIDALQQYVKQEPRFIKKSLDVVSDFMHQYPISNSNFGLIHGDHRKGNVLCDGKDLYIIDFDIPRFFWFMDDISRPFFSSIMQQHTNWQDKLVPYIVGYRSVFPLDKQEIENWVWFIRLKALNMYLWTKNNWSSDIAPGGAKTKDWLSLLYNMIENKQWENSLQQLIRAHA